MIKVKAVGDGLSHSLREEDMLSAFAAALRMIESDAKMDADPIERRLHYVLVKDFETDLEYKITVKHIEDFDDMHER
jgi:hypothetical protein